MTPAKTAPALKTVEAAAPAPARTTQTAIAQVGPRVDLLRLHRMYGNGFVQRMLTQTVQRKCACGGGASCEQCGATKVDSKISIGPVDDIFEREADQVAERVMRMPAPDAIKTSALTGIQRKSAGPEGAGLTLSGATLTAGGMLLPPAVQEYFEPRFGRDFSAVRVHSGSLADSVNSGLNSHAFTYGNHVWLGSGQHLAANSLLAHELTHVVQQNGSPVIRRQARNANPKTQSQTPSSSQPHPLEIEIVGKDATEDESLMIMAKRWARDHGGRVMRVGSIEEMIGQIKALLNGSTCLGKLVVWYHGSPEIQLVSGEYEIYPDNTKQPKRKLPSYRLSASGFTREWLQLKGNHDALTRFRHLFCCNGSMHWFGCGTATVRAGGGLRTPGELEREPALFQEHPDIYQSAREAIAHGAMLTGGSFGKVNVQAWANATCTTIRSATNLVTLQPKSPNPITIDNGGQWIDVPPQGQCPCDPATGRIAGEAPSREEIVKEWQQEIAKEVGTGNLEWHHLLSALRTGIPHATQVIGSGSQGERTFEARPGTLPAALHEEMSITHGTRDPKKPIPKPFQDLKKGTRGPLEKYYETKVLLPLLKIAGEGITPPPPLPNDPMPDDIFIRIPTGGSWAAVTQPHLAVVNRTDFWHWIVFNDQAIGETPEFTRTVIQHELQHAADYENDLRVFEAAHPRPTNPIPARFHFPAERSEIRDWKGTDPWGDYINDFIVFTKQRTAPDRHFQIILDQRKQKTASGDPTFRHWSAAERAYWFQLVFHNLPPDVPSGTPLPGEDEALATFNRANGSLQMAAVERAFQAICQALHPPKTPKPDPEDIAQAIGSALTLAQHFDPIIERVLSDHMGSMGRSELIRLLKRGPQPETAHELADGCDQ
jgi:hypothetical protein